MQTFIRRNLRFLLGGVALVLLLTFLVFQPDLPVGAQGTGYPSTLSTDPGKELDERIRVFFDDLLNTNTTKAFDDLFRSSQLGSTSGNASVADMKTRLEEMKKESGEFRDFEKVDEKVIGAKSDLVIVRYLLKCDSYPVVWTFTFYRKPGLAAPSTVLSAQWHLIGLKFDTNYDLLTL